MLKMYRAIGNETSFEYDINIRKVNTSPRIERQRFYIRLYLSIRHYRLTLDIGE